MSDPQDAVEQIAADDVQAQRDLERIAAKRDKNLMADMRRKGKRKSLINWKTFSMLRHQFNYTSENRRRAKAEQLIDAETAYEPNMIQNNGRRRRLRKYLLAEERQIERTRADLAPMKIGKTRKERRANQDMDAVTRRVRKDKQAMRNAATGAILNERRAQEQKLYRDATAEYASYSDGERPRLRDIQMRLARERRVTWRDYSR